MQLAISLNFLVNIGGNMVEKNDYSIYLSLYHKDKSYELNKFVSILLDTRDVNISLRKRKELINEMYEHSGIKRKDDVFTDYFNNIISLKYPDFNNVLLFISL